MRLFLSFLFSIGLLTATFSSYAGWYVVDNYEGNIGPYPIHMSLQRYNTDKSVKLSGSYYYNKFRSPIPLYGKFSADSLVACEIHSVKDYEKYILALLAATR